MYLDVSGIETNDWKATYRQVEKRKLAHSTHMWAQTNMDFVH